MLFLENTTPFSLVELQEIVIQIKSEYVDSLRVGRLHYS